MSSTAKPSPNSCEDSTSTKEKFSLENLRRHFAECHCEDGGLVMDKYIQGFEEVNKFLALLGTVFGWVASDVVAKVDILRNHRQAGTREKYETIQSMIEHEKKEDMLNHKARDLVSGTRNLLRLHRALEYITAFLKLLPALDKPEKCCPSSQAAYKKTLSKHHPWLVQKAALMAMNMLPTKEGLINTLCDNNEEEYKKVTETLPKACDAMDKVYTTTQELYEKHGILDLP